jgi:hypothetical protein
MTTALSYGREQELLGLPDTGRGLAQAIANEVTLECMQEEYEICRDNHIVTRIMRLRLGIDRQATVLGVTDPNATAYDDLVKACLKFALDLDSTTTTTSQKLTIVQSVQSRSIALELQGSIEEWRNGQNGKLKGMGPVVSTDYKVTTSVSCAPISDVTPMSSALEVGSLSLDTGDPPTDNIRDFKLVYRASPNFSFFKVNDACSNPPVVLPPVMENWFTDAAAVLYYKNPLNQAEGGYVITGWNVNLQSEIGRRSVTYVNLNGDILQTLDLDFRLRHVPSQ